jgi:tartrate-resistant acid phosphatase type 5
MQKQFNKLLILILFLSGFAVDAQKYAIISDIHGATSFTQDVAQYVKNWNPDFIITAGDNHYGSQTTIDFQVGQFYSDFISPYTGLYGTGGTANRFFPCLGNHDIDNNGLVSYLDYFQLPGNERYYDFVVGNIHFFSLNCNSNEVDGVSETSVQAMWLKNCLALSTSPYNVVYFHMPAYTSGMHGSTTYMRWPFKQWGASVVFSGHDHDYERLIVDSLTYIVCGVGGGVLYTVYNPLPGSLFSNVTDHGAVLSVANPDSMYFEFRNTADSLIDHFTIYPRPLSVTNKLLDSQKPQLFQNSPNPCNASGTEIRYYIPVKGKVMLKATDILGNSAMVYPQTFVQPGYHTVDWNTEELNGGFFYYSLSVNDYVVAIMKMLLIK